MLRFGKAPAVS